MGIQWRKGYFALNITDSAIAGAYTGDDLVFWEFTEEDDYPLDSSGNAFVDYDSKLFNDYQTLVSPSKTWGTSAPVIVMSNILTIPANDNG